MQLLPATFGACEDSDKVADGRFPVNVCVQYLCVFKIGRKTEK